MTGDGKCAKCALKETKECQNTVQVKDGDKTVTYYLVQNDISKGFHENICKGPKKVKATGTVKEVDGKMQLTLADGSKRPIGVDAVVGIEQVNGPVSWISSRTPSENVHTPFLGTTRPARRRFPAAAPSRRPSTRNARSR